MTDISTTEMKYSMVRSGNEIVIVRPERGSAAASKRYKADIRSTYFDIMTTLPAG